MIPKTLRNFTVFVDGVGYVGVVSEGTPPTLELTTEEYRGGGMAGPVDIPMGSVEKMEFEVAFKEFNAALIGQLGADDAGVTFRGAQGAGNEAVVIETRSLVREVDQGGWKAGEPGELKLAFTATYYKQTIAGRVAAEIDVVNMIFKTGGVDRLAGMKTALGVSS